MASPAASRAASSRRWLTCSRRACRAVRGSVQSLVAGGEGQEQVTAGVLPQAAHARDAQRRALGQTATLHWHQGRVRGKDHEMEPVSVLAVGGGVINSVGTSSAEISPERHAVYPQQVRYP